ncbi:PREDICTED: uncharacterized protein LOC108556708 isoform X2 [Nicrophorus vespilloides]|uniref:Uncharacterized protein LOC108556708 isoform X2 n=1 Tax=Nicrophorus vespilloides TaxID=110193 RepID=A0ABM1M1F7_NICVS|nr:PREDICTED: uncharacterized protein LOC108556708 isoform X2 [Nicrophorus vespilloides]
MADNNKPLYSTCVAILGFVCFIVGATAVGLPIWGYFDSSSGDEKGYFGPWKTCKLLLYHRERCGKDDSRFRPSIAVWVAGIVAASGVAILGVFCFLSILQLAMLSSKEKVLMKYSVVVIMKLAMGLLATLLAIAAAGLFALQADERDNNGFQITRGPAFYIQIMLILLNSILFVMSLYDMIFARRDGGDPTTVTATTEATTYGNPGFRDRPNPGPGGISMTDASGRPYSSATNGSMMSMNTTSTAIGSNGSTLSSVTRSPLRSSLKKPKPNNGLGIQNPGYSGSSPTFSRNGSVKKVRIQTHSTEV